MAPSTVTEQERAAFADDGFFLRRGAIPGPDFRRPGQPLTGSMGRLSAEASPGSRTAPTSFYRARPLRLG